MKCNIRVKENCVIVKGFYNNPKNIEKPYRAGLYGVFPQVRVKDCYSGRTCSNWMEWAYNNPFQPTSEKDPKTGKRMPFLDASGANAVKILGSMKTVWKEFVRKSKILYQNCDDLDINELESRFLAFYMEHYKENFERAVKVFQKYVASRRALMTEEQKKKERKNSSPFISDETWINGCRDFLEHLIYVSARGYMREVVLFTSLCQITGGSFQESSIQDERNGIDGYICLGENRKYPICLKPESYHDSIRCQSPIYKPCLVYYKKRSDKDPDLVFVFETGKEILEKNIS